MLCSTCGQAVPEGESYCANCGTDLSAAASQSQPAQAAAPVAAPAPVPAATGEPRGVGGWLLVFCIWLTIFIPLSGLRMVLQVLPYLHYLTLSLLLLFLVALGITPYAVFTGIQLWRVRAQALTHLRIYLVLAVALLVTVTFFQAQGESFGGRFWLFAGHARDLLFLALWVAYFRLSKRVRNTYGANL